MESDIAIQIRNLPREILSDFETRVDKSISLEIYEDINDHFDPPADVVIYINEHLTEIIISGVGVGLLTSAIWDGIKMLWAKVMKRGSESTIELNLKIKPDRTLEFTLESNIDPKKIEAVIENILKYIKDNEQQEKDFANPDLKERQDERPRIRVRYNPKIDRIEVLNFTVLRKENEERFRRMSRRLRS